MRESSVVSDVTTATDASEMFYDARESPADDLSASFKRDHINSGKSQPVVSHGWMSGNTVPSDKLPLTVGFVNCFMTVPMVYIPACHAVFCPAAKANCRNSLQFL